MFKWAASERGRDTGVLSCFCGGVGVDIGSAGTGGVLLGSTLGWATVGTGGGAGARADAGALGKASGAMGLGCCAAGFTTAGAGGCAAALLGAALLGAALLGAGGCDTSWLTITTGGVIFCGLVSAVTNHQISAPCTTATTNSDGTKRGDRGNGKAWCDVDTQLVPMLDKGLIVNDYGYQLQASPKSATFAYK